MVGVKVVYYYNPSKSSASRSSTIEYGPTPPPPLQSPEPDRWDGTWVGLTGGRRWTERRLEQYRHRRTYFGPSHRDEKGSVGVSYEDISGLLQEVFGLDLVEGSHS